MQSPSGGDRAGGTSGLVAILFTDLVGSTDLASRHGDAAADALRRDHFSHLREALASTGGTEIKTIGDSLMASFAGASDALAGAVAMQRAVERQALALGTELGMDGPSGVVPRAKALLT